MSVPVIGAAEAQRRTGEDGEATYVDVRTVAEFVTGRPRTRAVNLPWVFHHPTTGAEHPNDAFLLVAEHALDRATPLVVGGAADGRAAAAAQALLDAGFADVSVLEGGLEAWRAAGLPVTGDNRDGVSYVSLLTPARRAGKNRA